MPSDPLWAAEVSAALPRIAFAQEVEIVNLEVFQRVLTQLDEAAAPRESHRYLRAGRTVDMTYRGIVLTSMR